jgi:S-DNA-T family DNA segregation ATPase FtsK/SpoIIIE
MGERFLRRLIVFALFVFVCVSWVLYDPGQWPAPVTWQALVETTHPCGPLGLLVSHTMVQLLGRVLSVLIPVSIAIVFVARLARWKAARTWRLQTRLLATALLASLALSLAAGSDAGGLLGTMQLQLLGSFLGRVGTTILLTVVGAALLLRYGMPILRPVWEHTDGVRERVLEWRPRRNNLMRWTQELRGFWLPRAPEFDLDAQEPVAAVPRSREIPARPRPEDVEPTGAPRIRGINRTPQPTVVESPLLEPQEEKPRIRTRRDTAFELPGVDLLQTLTPEEDAVDDDRLLHLSRVLEEKLADFGIGGRVDEVQPGPVITTYEFKPAPGIKVSQVTNRVDDLAMALRAQAIRMVAPIPGKAAIGIEIPNDTAQMVGLREMMESWPKDLKVGPLGLALGKTVSGDPFYADLSTMPHLLVAGATGSGKSVCINAILCSLLLRHDPNDLKVLLVDPKMLELNAYRDIPHLLHPVVTDPKEAYKALHWMTLEMERRYRELAKANVRNIAGYNQKVRSGVLKDEDGRAKETLPYVVVVVDELADLMIQVGREIETPIARLAQMARAVGIHLILATQRPSVDVITGVIKANFPSRIAFQVSSRIDSRTILDTNGAETLLGRGDMLFLAGGRPSPIRVHGAFVSVEECERLAEYWRGYGEGAGELDLDTGRGEGSSGDAEADDELFEAARRLVVTSGVGSVSYLQRRLKVGYSRAARIMDMLEEAGVVGPALGSKPREVLESPEDLPEPVE